MRPLDDDGDNDNGCNGILTKIWNHIYEFPHSESELAIHKSRKPRNQRYQTDKVSNISTALLFDKFFIGYCEFVMRIVKRIGLVSKGGGTNYV